MYFENLLIYHLLLKVFILNNIQIEPISERGTKIKILENPNVIIYK